MENNKPPLAHFEEDPRLSKYAKTNTNNEYFQGKPDSSNCCECRILVKGQA